MANVTFPSNMSFQNEMESRAVLRQTLRNARKSLGNDAYCYAQQAIANQLRSIVPQDKKCNVAVYLENDGEVNLDTFITHCWTSLPNITFSLPVLHPVNKGHLLFLRYAPHTRLVTNKFNINEPELACYEVIPTPNIDLFLMPLVGFDKKGHRLGMGGGYYDRTLAFTQRVENKPTLIGIAHDIQEVDTLPIAYWDIPLDGIVTPTRILKF